MKTGYVYIIASKKNGTLYIGVTSNLISRIDEHKRKVRRGFSAKYNIDRLVYYERYEDISEAIYREKKIKVWKRDWKLRLIERDNPEWIVLYDTLLPKDKAGFLPAQE